MAARGSGGLPGTNSANRTTVHEYFFRPEVVRVALVVGVIVSILFYERVQLTTGGAIVPAYLTMFLTSPLFIVITLLTAYLTYTLVTVVIAKRWILYGRRKFEVEMLVSLGFVTIGTVIALAFAGKSPLFFALTGIGFLVPGVIAHDMFRQRPAKTLSAVVATTTIVALIVFLFASLIEISPAGGAFESPAFNSDTGYPIDLLLGGVIASVLVGMLTFARLGLRSGGFISSAYLALMLFRPADLLFTIVVALLTWFVVTRLVAPRLLIFGRRKLSTMVLVGVIIGWTVEIGITQASGGSYVPWSGFILMALMIPALLANDAQRQGLERTAWGVSITTAGVFGAMNLAAALLGWTGVL